MKLYSFFLPQFHRIPENDEWWGEGFTEWTNVKAAKPLYKGHLQPKIPLNNNYYDLLDKQTVKWQTDLMKEYGLHGLIYYHYYFKGRKLLEKPAENLLKWKDIEQRFFFCWANHQWQKTWEGSKTVLMPMEYGDESDWEDHFQYLLPFFKDDRYEKKDNMPLFMIFVSENKELKNIFEYFNRRCIENGFDGLYLIEIFMGNLNKKNYLCEKKFQQTKKIHYREPSFSKRSYDSRIFLSPEYFIRKAQRAAVKLKMSHKPAIYDNNKLFDEKLNHEPFNQDIIHGLSFEWDNTSRHHERGYVIKPVSKEKFFSYMDKVKNEEYLFIDAWNEWCEGMMLEPTEENGYKYLEWIKEWQEMRK